MPSSASGSTSASSFIGKDGKVDPITRTALRYSISPREYELLHQYLITRAPKRVQKRAPEPEKFEEYVTLPRNAEGGSSEAEDYRVASLRLALRAFIGTYVGFKGWEFVLERLASRRQKRSVAAAAAKARHPNLRYALSLSSILLFHRLLHRFFRRLRASLLENSAKPFRNRNPTISRLLTSSTTPAVGAAISGVLLGLAPSDQLRVTIAIYALTRSLEFAYNAASTAGLIWPLGDDGKPQKPSWFGSWMIMPFTCGQLLHAFVFDRECFPEASGRFILARSPEYIQTRPLNYPESKQWPGVFDIVDSLAELSRLRWPVFTSPTLFPNMKNPLPSPAALRKTAPITAPAHPLIKNTSCATLHPRDPSCSRTYLRFFLKAFPSVTKFFALMYSAFALIAYKALLKDPAPFLNRLSSRILRMSLFVTGAIGTSWGSICLFSNILPRGTLPTQRWFLGGFIGGMWAYVARSRERGNFLYSARLSVDCLWKVGVKRGWWKGWKGGDVAVFMLGLALLGAVFEKDRKAIDSGVVRRGLEVLRGEGVLLKGVKKSQETKKEQSPKERLAVAMADEEDTESKRE
ncbi:hypothetical protein K431DRAFT_281905 [Polychaeton citri CBS 116435]|uniref:Transmembrane protein 135 N-terminal domain-containing protein n=1 Tax=Polychaeton citri CBS 116435 TaxID=1314669 RepID=A0A9P4QGJ4_9PEZI|nr:hypothetical protein K431DRAFT_281905 [Polychaeton citri CBS 116435]